MSDRKESNKGSFWTTLPGCVSAIAALITAVGGCAVALYTIGIMKIPSPATPPFIATATLPLIPTVQLTFTSAPSNESPTPTLTPSVTPLPTETTDNFGVHMRLVPAGIFIMGSNDGELDEKPAHQVSLDAYYIDTYEVTNFFYKSCVTAGVCASTNPNSSTRANYYGNAEFHNYPVIWVDWFMAKTYCEWRGAQLPTEAQWEKAARGTDARLYPWGGTAIDCSKANFKRGNEYCFGDTTRVGSYPSGISPYGIYDMAGNVAEWTSDWYMDTFYQNSPFQNPLGPPIADTRVLRGGGWSYYYVNVGRSYDRVGFGPNFVAGDIGFRCSRSANP